jgi:type VI secretion system activator RovC-like protein
MTLPSDAGLVEDVPWSDSITAYDEAHFVVYVRLLDAAADGASADEMARIVLGIDPLKESERAQRMVASHLRRARWMTEHGYRELRGTRPLP